MAQAPRAWTIAISNPAGRPVLVCNGCVLPAPEVGATAVPHIRPHLADHLTETRLPPHPGTSRGR